MASRMRTGKLTMEPVAAGMNRSSWGTEKRDTEGQLSVQQMGEEQRLIIKMPPFYFSLYFAANQANKCSFDNCCPAALPYLCLACA